MEALILLSSYHHNNTEKLAKTFAEALDAEVKTPEQVDPGMLAQYNLVGFGSGIYDGKHHEALLGLADTLPRTVGGRAFLFSTCGIPAFALNEDLVRENHATLRSKLEEKGYAIVGEFGCAGFNTNGFLKFFGGLNKGRPNAEDLERARYFALGLWSGASST